MSPATMTLNRQVIRLCKGMIKAWEQWVEETDDEECRVELKPHSHANQEHYEARHTQ